MTSPLLTPRDVLTPALVRDGSAARREPRTRRATAIETVGIAGAAARTSTAPGSRGVARPGAGILGVPVLTCEVARARGAHCVTVRGPAAGNAALEIAPDARVRRHAGGCAVDVARLLGRSARELTAGPHSTRASGCSAGRPGGDATRRATAGPRTARAGGCAARPVGCTAGRARRVPDDVITVDAEHRSARRGASDGEQGPGAEPHAYLFIARNAPARSIQCAPPPWPNWPLS
jgi:hypothetical protein